MDGIIQFCAQYDRVTIFDIDDNIFYIIHMSLNHSSRNPELANVVPQKSDTEARINDRRRELEMRMRKELLQTGCVSRDTFLDIQSFYKYSERSWSFHIPQAWIMTDDRQRITEILEMTPAVMDILDMTPVPSDHNHWSEKANSDDDLSLLA